MLIFVLALCVGISIGFVSAIPVGPVGIVCIQRSIAKGRRAGFIAGSGAVFGDAFFAGVAAFGVTPIIYFFHQNKVLIGSIGGVIVILVGIAGLIASKQRKDIIGVLQEIPEALGVAVTDHRSKHRTLIGRALARLHRVLEKSVLDDFIASFFITVTNPITALSFFVMFGGIVAQTHEHEFILATALTAGAAIGSTLWWFTLSHFASVFAKRLKPKHLAHLNTVTSSIVVAIGLIIIIGLVRRAFF